MTPAPLQTIEEIFRGASALEPARVSAYLEKACNGNETLRRKVEALLASRETAANFIEISAAGLATRVMQRRQAASLVGRVIGHYKISHPIGTGGMGDVYLAMDIRAGRKAALKLLPTRFASDSVRLQRFQQEAHAVTALNHPNILTVYEIGDDGSTSYIASELIEGETLRQRLMRERIPLDEAVEIAIQVASALAAAHDAGIIHRDIKPENIMLRPDGYVKVLDFGIAKLAKEEFSTAMLTGEAPSLVATHLGSILGTVRYMSPEQTHGWQVDNSTDIWSLGAVLYEIVTGQAPFTGTTPDEVISAIFEMEPAPLTNYVAQAPAELREIVSKALCKDRSERYHDAQDLLGALKFFRRELEVRSELERRSIAGPSWLRWKGAHVAPLVALLAVGLAVSFYWHRSETADSPPEKSIAVLPFENLTKDGENQFFAGGLQEDILSDLAKIADLKVISRTSVMRYKPGKERNLREIAKALGVSHVLEGSVQRVGPRVRVNAQLIDARNDADLWAEHYDRNVADVFAIQTEIAQQIANQLQAKLSAAEKAAIAEPPTADLVAYAYYAKANEMDIWGDWEGAEKSASRKVELLQKAIERDPNFALAYCALAHAQVDFFKATDDRRHLDLARKAAEAALRVGPDLGEAHLELARYYFMVGVFSRDYQPARAELAIVQRKLPNNSEALWLEAMIDRHQNRWNNAIANLQKASALDPRNAEITYQLRQTYFEMRRYRESEQILTKDARSDAPVAPWIQILLADIKLAQGDPVAAQRILEQVPLDFSPAEYIWGTRFTAALHLRDFEAAGRVIAMTPPKWAEPAFDGPPGWAEGQVARARGDQPKARAAFARARKEVEAKSGDEPRDPMDLSEIAKLDAALGRKEDAIRRARRAVEILPIATDSLNGPWLVTKLALVYTWTGEHEPALDQLEIVASIPNGPTYGDLCFNPCWDDLRGEARFKKILAAAKAASK